MISVKTQRNTLLYTCYAVIVFALLCFLFVPPLLVLAQKKSWHALALRLHEAWGRSFFLLIFIRWEIIGKEKLLPGRQYIFCSNHFSYLDIPAFFLLYHAKFIGKSSISKIPLFGYFYKKIHILVDRASAKSRAESLLLTKKALDEGFNMTFFPEGGIKVTTQDIPYMCPFKDGAFRLAVEKGLPVIPLTMPYNYRIMPDPPPLRFHRHPCKIIVHDPVFPQGHGEAEILRLREQVFEVIQSELLAHHPDNVRSVG